MSNFKKANNLASEWIDSMGGLDNIHYIFGDDVSGLIQAFRDEGLLAPDVQVVRGLEELEELAREDAGAIVLASEAGVVRTAGALWEMHRLENMWGLPAAVIASGNQVRAAREAMEVINE